MVEDDTKVEAFLAVLNQQGGPGTWAAAEGFQMLPSFIFGKNGQPNELKVGEGVPVKIFFNNQTGETRITLAVAMTRNA